MLVDLQKGCYFCSEPLDFRNSERLLRIHMLWKHPCEYITLRRALAAPPADWVDITVDEADEMASTFSKEPSADASSPLSDRVGELEDVSSSDDSMNRARDTPLPHEPSRESRFTTPPPPFVVTPSGAMESMHAMADAILNDTSGQTSGDGTVAPMAPDSLHEPPKVLGSALSLRQQEEYSRQRRTADYSPRQQGQVVTNRLMTSLGAGSRSRDHHSVAGASSSRSSAVPNGRFWQPQFGVRSTNDKKTPLWVKSTKVHTPRAASRTEGHVRVPSEERKTDFRMHVSENAASTNAGAMHESNEMIAEYGYAAGRHILKTIERMAGRQMQTLKDTNVQVKLPKERTNVSPPLPKGNDISVQSHFENVMGPMFEQPHLPTRRGRATNVHSRLQRGTGRTNVQSHLQNGMGRTFVQSRLQRGTGRANVHSRLQRGTGRTNVQSRLQRGVGRTNVQSHSQNGVGRTFEQLHLSTRRGRATNIQSRLARGTGRTYVQSRLSISNGRPNVQSHMLKNARCTNVETHEPMETELETARNLLGRANKQTSVPKVLGHANERSNTPNYLRPSSAQSGAPRNAQSGAPRIAHDARMAHQAVERVQRRLVDRRQHSAVI